MTTRIDLAEGRALVAKALVPFGQMPDADTVARLTDRLLRHGRRVRDAAARQGGGAEGAFADWETLTTRGPADDGRIGAWSYCRATARTVRRFHLMLGGDPAAVRSR
ncbi:hypothetical protein [Streptomyces sp. NPDC101132]|uniref:hypothetical protein n=1 Tax=Streptomyces sp. NPDC101132 TaxID=3366110 RepID=UPI003811EE87